MFLVFLLTSTNSMHALLKFGHVRTDPNGNGFSIWVHATESKRLSSTLTGFHLTEDQRGHTNDKLKQASIWKHMLVAQELKPCNLFYIPASPLEITYLFFCFAKFNDLCSNRMLSTLKIHFLRNFFSPFVRISSLSTCVCAIMVVKPLISSCLCPVPWDSLDTWLHPNWYPLNDLLRNPIKHQLFLF